MKSIVIGAIVAAGLILGGCGGTKIPNHASCMQDSDCSDGGTSACHFPYGAANGLCVQTCMAAKDCPSVEPMCIPEGGASSPFSFCACSNPGPDGGVASGCNCDTLVQVCHE